MPAGASSVGTNVVSLNKESVKEPSENHSSIDEGSEVANKDKLSGVAVSKLHEEEPVKDLCTVVITENV